jgi:hypothetical protein
MLRLEGHDVQRCRPQLNFTVTLPLALLRPWQCSVLPAALQEALRPLAGPRGGARRFPGPGRAGAADQTPSPCVTVTCIGSGTGVPGAPTRRTDRGTPLPAHQHSHRVRAGDPGACALTRTAFVSSRCYRAP